MKLSLAVIARDEEDQIKRIIRYYEKYFDELVFLLDDKDTYDKLTQSKSRKAKFHLYTKSKEEEEFGHIFFDRKRNELTKLLKGDYYFRLDTDDAIIDPQNIRSIAERAKAQNVNIVYCFYEYAKDMNNNVCAAHYRETIVKVTDALYWNKHIHENIIPTNASTHRYVIEDSIKIEHRITYEGAQNSEERNLKYLVAEYLKDKEKTDPRTLAYLGRMLYTKDIDKAQFFLEKHIASSGWDEDRYMSWCMLADIMVKRGQFKDAIGCCHEAMAERPDYPGAYFKLHDVYMAQEDWGKAIIWARLGFQIPQPKTFMIMDPASVTWRPLLSLAYAYYQTEQFQEAWDTFQLVKKYVTKGELYERSERLFGEAMGRKKFTDHFMWMFEFLRTQEPAKAKKLFDTIPTKFDDHQGLMTLKHMTADPKTWSKKSVVFFCGKTPADWADPSVLKGLGGSEEAVVYLSRELVKLGYEVTVYCTCGKLEGTYNGVQYLNTYKMNPRDHFNIFFAWRSNVFQLNDLKANKRYIWLHDVPQEQQFDTGKYNFDKVIVLSEYHKSLLPKHIPQEKIYVSTNGLNLPDFKGLDNIQRQSNRLIYASSYDRGLEELLTEWSRVRESVPDAELHIFYGWNTYKELVKVAGSNRSTDFVDRMEKLMDQPGVFNHGRVGHKDLLREYARSRVFAYPCKFIGEINCIALTKAIACGCVAVTNNFAVLPERNLYKVSGNGDFTKSLIEELKNPTEVDEDFTLDYAIDNSWTSVALDWNDALLTHG